MVARDQGIHLALIIELLDTPKTGIANLDRVFLASYQEYCASHEYPYFECSADSDEGITKAFRIIAAATHKEDLRSGAVTMLHLNQRKTAVSSRDAPMMRHFEATPEQFDIIEFLHSVLAFSPRQKNQLNNELFKPGAK